MREAISHSGLRMHQWLILFGALLYGIIYMGVLEPRGIAAWFANQPKSRAPSAIRTSAAPTRSSCCSRHSFWGRWPCCWD